MNNIFQRFYKPFLSSLQIFLSFLELENGALFESDFLIFLCQFGDS
jgi:hypothetical protein